MNEPVIRLIRNKKELQEVFRIRQTVFIKGQNVPKDIEWDDYDSYDLSGSTAKHVILFYNGKPAGCARIRFIGRDAKLERIAILASLRGKGLGKKLMEYLRGYCKRKKAGKMIMHAQTYAQGFYKKFGFKPAGKIFLEAGIRHIKMYMKPDTGSKAASTRKAR